MATHLGHAPHGKWASRSWGAPPVPRKKRPISFPRSRELARRRRGGLYAVQPMPPGHRFDAGEGASGHALMQRGHTKAIIVRHARNRRPPLSDHPQRRARAGVSSRRELTKSDVALHSLRLSFFSEKRLIRCKKWGDSLWGAAYSLRAVLRRSRSFCVGLPLCSPPASATLL